MVVIPLGNDYLTGNCRDHKTVSERIRLESLRNLSILDTPPDAYIDALTRATARHLGAPICLLSLVDEGRQWFKSKVGLEATETPREMAFCHHAIKQDDIYEITDATDSKVFQDNPLVTGDPNIRFYAGAPIKLKNDQNIGTLCVIDNQARQLNSEQKSYLLAMKTAIEVYLQDERVMQQHAQMEQFQNLLAMNNEDLIFVKDEAFRITYANPAFLRLYPDKTLSDILGTTTFEDYLPEDVNEFLKFDKIAFEQGESETLEEILFPDGKNRWLWTKKTRYLGSDNRHYILAIARDVTERERNNRKLKQSLQDLDNFAYVASHDLKAPLNGIEKVTSWIEDDLSEHINEEIKGHFTLINGRILRMRNLLDDLLEYSRVGRLNYEIEQVNLQETVNDLVGFLDVDEGFVITSQPFFLKVHKVPFEMALRNLIQNAIKHHDANHGHIHIQCVDTARSFVIDVDDDGPGIPETLREKAKSIFQTLKSKDEVEGSGLGLALVEKSLRTINGSLELLDSPLGGCRVRLNWPKFAGDERHDV